VALGQLAYARALLGDADAAARAAAEAGEARHALSRIDELFVGRGQAWAAVAAGRLSEARDGLARTAAACAAAGQRAPAAQAWFDVARLGDATRAAGPLRDLAGAHLAADPTGPPQLGTRVDADPGALTILLAAHVEALAARDADGVARAARAHRTRGHLLHAAEAATQVAFLHGARRRAEADRWTAVADELLAGCEGTWTPALSLRHGIELTAREREVVGLVARGLTNPDIAAQLHLSVRTVGNHLHAAFGKLGVHRRDELTHLHLFAPPGAD
jgi:DNA-binding CsgD family transcriptional regulator